jgi:hypothetical protein
MMFFLVASFIFKLINETYIAERKATFDKFGEYGLKEGIPGSKESMLTHPCY